MPQKTKSLSLGAHSRKICNVVQGCCFKLLEIVRALPSGYNRDFQETKRPAHAWIGNNKSTL